MPLTPAFFALAVALLTAQTESTPPPPEGAADERLQLQTPRLLATDDPTFGASLDAPTLVRPATADEGALDDDHDRKKQDYDGRGDDYSPSPAVWAPRVILFPFYAVDRWVLRAPLRGAGVWIDKHHALVRLKSWLTWDDGKIGIFPIFQIGNGQRPGFGLSMFANKVFVPWHSMKAAATTDFSQNIMSGMVNTFQLGHIADLNLTVAYQQRNDLVFYGTGKRSLQTDQTRFERHKPLAGLELVLGSGAGASNRANSSMGIGEFANGNIDSSAASHLGARFGIEFSNNDFQCTTRTPDICGPDHKKGTPDDRFTLDKGGEAAYFYSGYSLMRLKALLSVDSRSATSPDSSGVRFDAFGRYGRGIGDRSEDVRFFRYGGELSGFIDLTKRRHRVLAARLYVEMLDKVNGSHVPFEELITLGGFETMRGFLRARFQGQSAVVASLEYRWPVWSFLDADLFYDLGNVFDEHLKDFDVNWLRSSYGVIFRTSTSRDVAFSFSFGVGSKAGSARPDEFRMLAGTNFGF